MIVKELIEKLQTFDPNLETAIFWYANDYGQIGQRICEIKAIAVIKTEDNSEEQWVFLGSKFP